MRTWRIEVLGDYPHPGRGFTQGLIAGGGAAREIAVWESTGLYGQSALCRYRLGQREPQRRAALPDGLFGEGICRVGGGAYLWQLTWQERVALRWDARTLELVEQVPYNREGWGICASADSASAGAAGGSQAVFTSDGSSELVRRDPDTLAPRAIIMVRAGAARVRGLNDLAFASGRIWANVIGAATVLGIDPDSGEVTDLVSARRARERHIGDPQAVLNGIAALPADGEFLLTGKTYHRVRHVRLVPVSAGPFRRPRRLSAAAE
jgi:glutamine cyclotransferase